MHDLSDARQALTEYSEYDVETGVMTGTVALCQSAPKSAVGRGWIAGRHCRHRSRVVSGAVEGCAPIQPSFPPGSGMSWAWNESSGEWSAVLSYDGKCAEVRAERARRMSEFDWMALRKIRTGEPIPEIVQAYMQQLADVTAQPGFPFDVKWPAKPGE